MNISYTNFIKERKKYMENPGKQYWDAVKWLLRYLKGTSDECLKFGIDDTRLIGYCNSDFTGDLDGRKSTLGMVFTLVGTVISWMSSLQEVTTLSTTEAEYIASGEII